MARNWLKTFTFIYSFSIVELPNETALKNTNFNFFLYIVTLNPLIPYNPVNKGSGPNLFSFVTIPHQPLTTCKISAQLSQGIFFTPIQPFIYGVDFYPSGFTR